MSYEEARDMLDQKLAQMRRDREETSAVLRQVLPAILSAQTRGAVRAPSGEYIDYLVLHIPWFMDAETDIENVQVPHPA